MGCAEAVVALLLSLAGTTAVPGAAGAGSGAREATTGATPREPAIASSSASWLEWPAAEIPDSCVDVQHFAEKVERTLGRSPAAAARDAGLTIVARIDHASPAGGPPHWSGEIGVRHRDRAERLAGSRTIDREGVSCQPLVDALALVTALVLAEDGVQRAASVDGAGRSEAPPLTPPSARSGERPEGRSDAERSTGTRTPAASARVETAASPAPPRAWKVGVEGGIALAVGLLPEASPGADATVFVRFPGGVKLFATAGAWSRQTTPTGAGQGATLELLSAGVGICPLGGPWRGWAGSACVRGDVGRLRATGFGFTSSTSQVRATLDAAASLEVQRRLLGPLYAGASAAVVVPFVRDRITYVDSMRSVDTIFRPAPLAGIAELRLGCMF